MSNKYIKKVISAFILIMGIIFCGCGSNTDAEKGIVDKLVSFTQFSKEENRYMFSGEENNAESLREWRLLFSEETVFIRLYDDDVCNSMEEMFGENSVEKDGTNYNLIDNRISISLDDEVADGVSSISYYIDDDNYKIMQNNEWYKPSSELQKALDSDVIGKLQDDVAIIKQTLEKNEITFADLRSISYEDLKEVIDNSSDLSIDTTKELQANEKTETIEVTP